MTMAIILLHMFWGVVFFDACEKQRWWAVAAVVVSHLVVSCLVRVVVLKGHHTLFGGSLWEMVLKIIHRAGWEQLHGATT